jgi:membrane associated rhomboid family serine protease
MIFPFLRGILSPYLTPATWFLLAVNVIVFVSTYPAYVKYQRELDSTFRDETFMSVQGSAFAQTIGEEPRAYSRLLRKLAERAREGDTYSRTLLGGFAVRDKKFMENADTMKFDGDDVALVKWREKFLEIRDIQSHHPTYKWGLSAQRAGFMNWITYQFAHSGWHHLFWNMVFLLLFATFLEATLGSSLVILIYLGSGAFGAAFFCGIAGLSYSPLIGASGAISGLMACVVAYMWQKPVRYFYFLVMHPGYFGFRYLPAWLIGVVYLIPDIAGHISTVADVSGLAYAAHIGGAIFGAVAGYAARRGWLVAEPLVDTPTTAAE